ncbi:Uncharacterised protein [Pantoea agglomerans]|uniref:Uncharacterized protein n=1 Tax=Enterobacter agglomerans TaxID=549 RepID=A0A379A9H5_ENTAG|nr:Uncharacterised protein [Pantoea agglomerans]
MQLARWAAAAGRIVRPEGNNVIAGKYFAGGHGEPERSRAENKASTRNHNACYVIPEEWSKPLRQAAVESTDASRVPWLAIMYAMAPEKP